MLAFYMCMQAIQQEMPKAVEAYNQARGSGADDSSGTMSHFKYRVRKHRFLAERWHQAAGNARDELLGLARLPSCLTVSEVVHLQTT